MSPWGIFGKKTQTCTKCGLTLNQTISRKLAEYFALDDWVCPNCDLHIWDNNVADYVIVSDTGVIIQSNPLLVTVQKKADEFEILIGIGSIQKPAESTLRKVVKSGKDALSTLTVALTPEEKKTNIEAIKRHEAISEFKKILFDLELTSKIDTTKYVELMKKGKPVEKILELMKKENEEELKNIQLAREVLAKT